jgi:hypothetical protein
MSEVVLDLQAPVNLLKAAGGLGQGKSYLESSHSSKAILADLVWERGETTL